MKELDRELEMQVKSYNFFTHLYRLNHRDEFEENDSRDVSIEFQNFSRTMDVILIKCEDCSKANGYSGKPQGYVRYG